MSTQPNLECLKNLNTKRSNNEGIITETSVDQETIEDMIVKLFNSFEQKAKRFPDVPKLLRWEHSQYLKTCLINLATSYECLDASRTWLCYWILHSLTLLDIPVDDCICTNICKFLEKCQHPQGGFGGGPGQFAHLAPTYAAVNALCIIGTDEAYNVINRETLQQFLWSVRSKDGAFALHKDGEVDIRGVYCALAVATLTNIQTEELFDNTAEWVVGCQTYEGGFSGNPGMEAHGGYTFCGLAALTILRKTHLCDNKALLRWTVNKQMRLEGGFQGRTNKLVDGCYSFWQGGLFVLINNVLNKESLTNPTSDLLFNQAALQEYILICCQHPSGGLLDKPGKPRDLYHTCYTLSGLSIAQMSGDENAPFIVGSMKNEVAPTHPVYNICPVMVYNAMAYFANKPSVFDNSDKESTPE